MVAPSREEEEEEEEEERWFRRVALPRVGCRRAASLSVRADLRCVASMASSRYSRERV